MPEIGWSAFVEKHPIAHLVAAIIPVNRAPVMPSYVQDLRQLIVRLVGRFNLSGDFAVKVEGETHAPALHDSPEIHTAFSRREDADKMATGVQARRVSEYTGWATQRIAIEPFDGDSAEREIRLVPEAVLRGRVVDAAGGPGRDAYVAVGTLADEGRRQRFAAKSFDATGRFEIPALPPGAAELLVRTRDSVLVVRRRVDVAAGAVLDAGTIELPADVALRGVVRDADGRPVGGATVRCDAGENLGATTVTMPDGSFELNASRGFPAALLVKKHGLATGVAWFDGGSAASPCDVRLLAEARLSIVRPANAYGSLWVRTTDGRVTWQPESRDADGALELDGIPPGRIVVVFDPGATERTRDVVAVAGKTVVVRFDE